MSTLSARAVLAPNRRSLEIQRDNALDQVSFLQDKHARVRDFLTCLATDVSPITPFDINEALEILGETRAESEARRFPEAVLDSGIPHEKEDQK